MKLITHCQYCQAPLITKFESKDRIFYKCGHSSIKNQGMKEDEIKTVSFSSLKSLNSGKTPFDFQIDGIKFGLEQNGNFLLGDAMGNGKTMQSLLIKKLLGEEHKPILIVVKSATTVGWEREILDWYSNEDNAVYVIQGKQTLIPRGFQTYVISMDSLAANIQIQPRKLKKLNGQGTYFDPQQTTEVLKEIRKNSPIYKLGIKSTIIDECHSFKDDDSLRTRALLTFIKENNLQGKNLPMSGTAIKNRADEYFVALNLIQPSHFPFRSHFQTHWLEKNDRGQYSRIKSRKLNQFQDLIKPFVLRREKSKSLPPLFKFPPQVVTLTDKEIKDTYNKQLRIFEFKMRTEKLDSFSILGEIAKLRKITAMAKIPFFLDYAEEMFENFELESEIDPNYPCKLACGIHHEDVRNMIKASCSLRFPWLKTFTLSGKDNNETKQELVDKFNQNPKEKSLGIISQLAGGVGLNIQGCCNYVILEREWSPADEDQFISRFHRTGQKYPVHGRVISAANTIDDFFDEILREKEKIFGETIQGWSLMQDSESLKKLVDKTLMGGL